jgi:hypothetical protein
LSCLFWRSGRNRDPAGRREGCKREHRVKQSASHPASLPASFFLAYWRDRVQPVVPVHPKCAPPKIDHRFPSSNLGRSRRPWQIGTLTPGKVVLEHGRQVRNSGLPPCSPFSDLSVPTHLGGTEQPVDLCVPNAQPGCGICVPQALMRPSFSNAVIERLRMSGLAQRVKRRAGRPKQLGTSTAPAWEAACASRRERNVSCFLSPPSLPR